MDGRGADSGRALYAEEKKNVSIIFSDIVGFSRIADGIKPMRVMDMLQNLFNRYDALCEMHGVYKVETIGDGCVMAAVRLPSSPMPSHLLLGPAARVPPGQTGP